jgi:hypothetical protein
VLRCDLDLRLAGRASSANTFSQLIGVANLDAAVRKQLENLALEGLAASADDEEEWSFLFRTQGAVSLIYYPWSEVEDLEFDGGVDGLDLPWTPERLDLIKRGKAAPDEEELRQWREATCRQLAAGTEWSCVAWIVPLVIDQKTAGYALFLVESHDPDDPPELAGIFDTPDNAQAALAVAGAIYGASDQELPGKGGADST